MVRLVPIALFLFASPAWSQATSSGAQPIGADEWQIAEKGRTFAREFQIGNFSNYELSGSGSQIFAGAEVSPKATVGLGMFGLKPERAQQMPVTARELGAPRTRRAGVGVRVKF